MPGDQRGTDDDVEIGTRGSETRSRFEMSDEKSQAPQQTQQTQPRLQADALDAQYKPIGISAICAASALKGKKSGPQMS